MNVRLPGASEHVDSLVCARIDGRGIGGAGAEEFPSDEICMHSTSGDERQLADALQESAWLGVHCIFAHHCLFEKKSGLEGLAGCAVWQFCISLPSRQIRWLSFLSRLVGWVSYRGKEPESWGLILTKAISED